jgi:trimeric autotransporter adhesin
LLIPRKSNRTKLNFCSHKESEETRRKMNSFKKIALGLAAAMSFGVMSALPTSAAVNAPTLTIDSATDAVTSGESATAVVTLSFISETSADTATIISAMFSQPTGSAKSATLSLLETSTSSVVIAGNNVSASINSTVNTPTYVTAKFLVTLNTLSVAGTYEAKILTTSPINGPSVSWTVTVKAADLTPSASTTTSILNAGEVTTATADATVYAPKATSTDAAAVIVVTPKNAAGGSATESILATVSGSGMIGSGSNATSISAQGRSLVISSGNYIGVFADGTAGVSTITLTTLTGTVIATEKVTFYGDIASIVATAVKPVIAVGSNASTIKAVAYDASGVTVGAGTLNVFSSDVSVVSDSGTAATIVNGEAVFTLTGVKTGGVAVTVKSGIVSSSPVPTRVEGTAATVKLSFDKEVYLPGEAAVITVQVIDASGLPVSGKTHANLFATGGIVPNYAFGATSDVLTATSVTTDTATVKTYKVFMPLTENVVKISATGGSSLPLAGQVTVTASAEVSNAAAKAATKASEEAAAAANAATNAALAAAKAADAATAAAQKASDSVAALSESVNKLIASLQAQIKSLAAVVAKIAKKVKA